MPSTKHSPTSKPKIIRDKKGRIIKGVAQDTNKNGTAGAPTKYDPAYCGGIIQYFSQECVKEIVEVVEGKNWTKETTRYEPVFFPTFELFAAQVVGVDVNTLLDWSKTHPDFSRAYTRAKEIQKGVLLRFATLGKFNSNFAQFLAINNMGMESKNKIEATQEITHKFQDLDDEQLDAAIKAREDRLLGNAS